MRNRERIERELSRRLAEHRTDYGGGTVLRLLACEAETLAASLTPWITQRSVW